MFDISRMYLIGAAGSGMLPLALLLKQAGHAVSGSDKLGAPARLLVLEANGIELLSGTDPSHIRDVDCVVVSPAIPETHVVRRAAVRDGVPIKTRAEVLAGLIGGRTNICVAGSHGKSTTTAMLVHILTSAGVDDFGYMLGASFVSTNVPPARWGRRDSPFVLEACEAHGALANWQPSHVILTNIDDDHADHYGGLAELRGGFAALLSRVPHNGSIVACGDDPYVIEAIGEASRDIMTYGFTHKNTLRAVLDEHGIATIFLYGQQLGTLSVEVAGQHNLLNALGALGMALKLRVDFQTATRALAKFKGIERRMQRIPTDGPLHIFDDIAHHPTEIVASLDVLRETAPGRLIAILEPQLHSRVAPMASRFAQALALADCCFVLPVASLGETTRSGNGDTALAEATRSLGLSCKHVEDFSELVFLLQNDLQFDDTLLVMAGNSGVNIAQRLAELLSRKEASPSDASVLIGERRPLPLDLLMIVAEHAALYPMAPAVEMGHRKLSYAELVVRTNDLSAALLSAGVHDGDSVGVCLGRSVDRVTAFLAILQIGGIFVPLDPALPHERLRYMLEIAGAKTVIVNGASPALPDIGLRIVNCGQLPDHNGTCVGNWQPRESATDALAYMIFTSGTTGKPKAVEISRGALANYAVSASRHFEITRNSRVSQIHGFGFDVSVGDMAMALAVGACLIYPTDIQALPGPPVGRFILQASLTHLSLTPSALSIIPQVWYPSLSHVIVAGEACPSSLVKRWGRDCRFINAYGPTEATVEAMFAVCIPDKPVTIGKPMDNVGACLMNESLQIVASGNEGELCLFGPGLAKGYRHLPELTERQFPVVDIPNMGPTRIYRTGDRAKVGPDGNFLFLGRIDSQLNFRGYRIEPGEVEAALSNLPGVSDAVVSIASSSHSPDRLVTHLVIQPDAPPLDPVDVRAKLLENLPSYMVPSVFLPIPEIPRNSSGKRDLKALPLPPQMMQSPNPCRVSTATEARLMELIHEQLGSNMISGTRESLLDAGVDSLSMANLLFAIEDAFGISLDVSFEGGSDTVEVLALMVDAKLKTPNVPLSSDIQDVLVAKITPYLSTWPGGRFGKIGLVRSLSEEEELPKLFWCFQGGNELSQLDLCLSGAVSLFGMRSGHLVAQYTAETLKAFGSLYADEIAAIAPTGPVFLGGNCQGGLVMRAVGLELMQRGREVALTILMEQGRFHHYPGKTLLLFGAGSYLNPYGHIAAPVQLFRTAYPTGYHVEIIPGAHGQYFATGNVEALSETILRHIERHGDWPLQSQECTSHLVHESMPLL